MSEDRIQSLIEKLRDFKTRSAASEALIAAGRDALDSLLDALKREESEGAKWAILHCLGEIRAAKAVPAMAPYLDQSDYQTVTHDALVKIAGRDLGPLPVEWVRWAERHVLETGEELEAAEEAETGASPSNARLMELALAEGVATFREEEPGRYVVSLPLAGGATQHVAVVFGGTDHEGSEIVIIFSHCGEARREYYETALRLNLRMPYGALALRDVGGKPYFVMFNKILRQALTPIELRKSIFTVGERAYRVERELRQ
jgi:hypothetical protein